MNRETFVSLAAIAILAITAFDRGNGRPGTYVLQGLDPLMTKRRQAPERALF